MKSVFLTILLFFIYTSTLQAQDTTAFPRPEISIGPEYAIPVGAFREHMDFYSGKMVKYNYGLGGSAKYLYRFSNTSGVSLQAGAIRYHSNEKLNFTAIPVKLGLHFRYKAMFAEPQLGLTWFAGNSTVYQSGATTYGANLGGYITQHIALSGNFERWNKGGFGASHWGVRLAYAWYTAKHGIADNSGKTQAASTANHWQYDKESAYWKKHRTFKTLGWVSVGVGLPTMLVGALATVAAAVTSHDERVGNWITGSGAVLVATGGTCFAFSSKYKRKARVAPAP